MKEKVKNSLESSHAPACFYSHTLCEISLIYDEEPLLILALRNLWIYHLFLQQKNSISYNESSYRPTVRVVGIHALLVLPIDQGERFT